MSTVQPADLGTLELVVSSEMVRRFAALTGDHSSLHTDEAFARRSMYRRTVVHGMLPVACLLFSSRLVRAARHARVERLSAKFIRPAFVGDELALVVEPMGEPLEGRGIFEFRVERRPTREELTRGQIVLEYEPETSRAARADDAEAPPPLASPTVAMRSADIASVAKGDVEGFEFGVTREFVGSFLSMLREGVSPDGAALRADPAFEASGMLAIALLSTLVGMRLPGETATFLDFEAELSAHVEPGAYRLEGRVAHVSRSTSIVKIDVSIGATDAAAGAPVLRGRVAVLVNKPARVLKSIEDLRRSATDLGLRDKVVLISGASRGIGETTAKLFALFGAKVVLNYRRSKSDAERIAAEIVGAGGEALAVQGDVSDAAEVAAMVDAAVARFGGVDVLVNNAVRDFRSIAYADLGWEEMQADLDVALKGAFLCCKLVTPHMLRRGGGKIVNISSIYADNPPPDQLKYVVSKAALEGLARGLAAEFAGKNIQVNTVVPSFVDTDVSSQMLDAIRSRRAQESPMKRNATPEDVAQAVVFLASSFASYTTGQRVLVTGGGAPYL